jgi:hypothetical protein
MSPQSALSPLPPANGTTAAARGATVPDGSVQEPPGERTPSVTEGLSPGFGSWIAMLALTAPAVPILAGFTTFVVQLIADKEKRGVVNVLALAAVLVAWTAIAYSFRKLSAFDTMNTAEASEIRARLARVRPRLAALQPAGAAALKPACKRTDNRMLEIAWREAHQQLAEVKALMGRRGLPWALGTGYASLWKHLHRAEEALIELDPEAELVRGAYYDQLRLSGSAFAQAPAMIEQLQSALAVLNPDAAVRYLGACRETVGGERSCCEDCRRMEARAVLRQIRRAVNQYRDALVDELVRQRNLLMRAQMVTAMVTYLLVVAVAIRDPSRESLFAAAVFFLLGALVGVLSQLMTEAGGERAIEDYGLHTARLVVAPLVSGLAAVTGVIVVGLLQLQVLGHSLGPDVGPNAVPSLGEMFSLRSNVHGLVVALAFGLTPKLAFDYLAHQTQEVKANISSSEPSSRSRGLV